MLLIPQNTFNTGEKRNTEKFESSNKIKKEFTKQHLPFDLHQRGVSLPYSRKEKDVSKGEAGSMHGQGSHLQDVGEEVVVEHGPVLAADVHDDFAELVPDEVRQSFVVGQQQLGQAAPDLHLVLGWHPQPHLIDQVL